MKEKIAFPQLVGLVAEKASTTERMSELFLRELFATLSQNLINGKSMTIKGLGTFKTVTNNSETVVQFIPDNALAKTVNAPFSQFKPVELCDEVTDEQLAQIDASMESLQEEIEQEKFVEIIKEEKNEKLVEKESFTTNSQEESNSQEAPTSLVDEKVKTDAIEPTTIPKKRNWLRWTLVGIAASAAIALIVFMIWGRKTSEHKPVVAATQTDSVKTPSPVITVITDTLTGNNVLTRMAKKHYGDQAFWVYIARENQSKYPNYHDIPNGTAIVIPPAEKYGINSDSKQSLRSAHAEAIKLRNELNVREANIAEPTTTEENQQTVQDKEKSDGLNSKKSNRKQHSHHSHHRSHNKSYRHR